MNNTTIATVVLSTIESNATNENDADAYLLKVGLFVVHVECSNFKWK